MNILITGGSGLVGKKLTALLQNKGHKVGILTRSVIGRKGIKEFLWNVEEEFIDIKSLEWADNIIHLAGENVGQRWTDLTKKQIIDSRVLSTSLLTKAISSGDYKISSFISASAIGYYGIDTGEQVLNEDSKKGEGFLADVVDKWEAGVDSINPYVSNLLKLRVGVVLTSKGGALGKMAWPIKLGVGAPLGSGKQWMSWIDVDDLCSLILFSLENSIHGLYNAVSPNPVTNKEMTDAIAKKIRRYIIIPFVPSFVLKLLFGEMSTILLGGNRVSSVAIQEEGFKFEYSTIDKSLANLL